VNNKNTSVFMIDILLKTSQSEMFFWIYEKIMFFNLI